MIFYVREGPLVDPNWACPREPHPRRRGGVAGRLAWNGDRRPGSANIRVGARHPAPMTNLQRRLRKIEGGLGDRSGSIPNSPAWLEYWTERADELIAEQKPGHVKIPL